VSQDKYDKIARDNQQWQDKDFPGTIDMRGVGIGVTPLPTKDESFLDERFGQQLARESQGLRSAITKMVNESADAELRGELEKSGVRPESESVTVAGHEGYVTYANGNWLCEVDVTYEDGSQETLQWEGSDRSEVLVDAASYLRVQTQPKAVTPSPADLLKVSRLAGSGQLGAALEAYISACWPQIRDEKTAKALWESPDSLPILNRAVFYVWAAAQPNFSPATTDVDFEQYVYEYAAGRPLTINLVEVAWQEFKKDGAMGKVREALREPTPDEIVKGLDELDDSQIDSLRRASLNAYHRANKGAR